MDEAKARFMEAFAALNEGDQRRLLFLMWLLSHCKRIEPPGGNAAQQDAPTSPTA